MIKLHGFAKDVTRHHILRIINENQEKQKNGELSNVALTEIIEKELKITSKEDSQHIYYLALSDYIELLSSRIEITLEGAKMLTSEKLLKDYWDRFNSKLINFGMLSCNIILAIAVFFSNHDSMNTDAINSTLKETNKILQQSLSQHVVKTSSTKVDTLPQVHKPDQKIK